MTSPVLTLPRLLGKATLSSVSHIGRLSLLIVELVRGLKEVRIWFPRAMTEAWNIGVGSFFIVVLVSGFAGGVTALQAGYQFTGTIPVYFLAGRIGARYAAELGTMRVTEQIDALESLGRSPASHLLIPRVVAGFIMIPVLVIFANAIGIISGWKAAQLVLPLTDADFYYGARFFWRPFDAYYSIIKAFFFAGSITIIACYMGFNTKQGAEGVGKATTGAVVYSSILILLLDVLLAKILLKQ
jgi:phospholipid/cholesterol/gamma-HCH transport system permease protein